MVTITIRDVPGDIHAVLIDRAAQQGLSLQTYVLRELIEMAERPDLETWLDAVNKSIERHDYHMDPRLIVEDIRQMRIDASR